MNLFMVVRAGCAHLVNPYLYVAVAMFFAAPGKQTLAQPHPVDADESFGHALSLFEMNLFAQSAEAFSAFREQFPDDARISDAFFYQAESTLADGREDEAVRLLKIFDAHFPRHPFSYQAHLTLGKHFFEAGSYDRTISVLAPVVTNGPRDEKAAIALYWMGESESRLGRPNRAIDRYRRILSEYPDSESAPRAGYAIAYNQVQLGRYDEAADSFEDLRRSFPNSPFAQNIGLALAEVYYELDDYGRTVGEINRRLPNLGPDARFRALFLLAESYNQLRDSKNAILNYRHFTEGEPQNPYYRRSLFGLAWNYHHEGAFEWAADNFRLVYESGDSDLAASAMYYEAVNLKLASQESKADDVFEEFVDRYPNSELADHGLFELGILRYEQRRWTAANSAFLRLVDQYPESPLRGQALLHLGNTFIATGDFDGALHSFDQAIGLEATASELKNEIIFQKAWLLYRNRDYERSSSEFMSLFTDDTRSEKAGETLFWAAESYFQLQQYDRSENLFTRYLREFKSEEHVDAAHYALGWTYFKEQKYERAVPEFESFLAATPVDTGSVPYVTDARLRLADSYFALKQYSDAVRVYGQAAGNGDDYALYQIGQAYSNAGDAFEAITTFRQLLEEYPVSEWREEAQYSLGYLYFLNQDFEQAIQAYERVISRYPGDPLAAKAQYGIGDAYFNDGRLEAALSAYQEVLTRYPESSFAADAAAGIQFALLANNEEDRADAIVDSFMVANPNSPVIDQLRFRQAEVRYQSGDTAEALQLFQQFIRTARDETLLPEAYYYLGSIYSDRQATTEAIAYLRQITNRYSNSPRYTDAARTLGHLYLSSGHPEEADALFLRLEQSRPDEIDTVAEARYGRSLALIQMGQRDEAESVLLDAIRSAPESDSSVPAYLGLARLRLDEGDYQEAVRLFELVVGRSRSEYGAEALFLLGQSQYDTGDAQQAIATLGRMSELYAGYPDWMARSLLQQARAFHSLGERGQAVQLYQQVIDDYPGTTMSVAAQTALEELGQ